MRTPALVGKSPILSLRHPRDGKDIHEDFLELKKGTDQTPEGASCECEHVASQRRGADHHDAQAAAHAFAHLAEHQLIPD